MIEALRILFGSVLALFLPGFALSWVLFPEKTEINWLERMALAFGLSIAIVPVTVFYANYLFGVVINIRNLTLITAAMTIIAYLGYVERTRKSLGKRMKKKSLSEPLTAQHQDKRKPSENQRKKREIP